MENKELENAILTIKNHCENTHKCIDCEMMETCINIDNTSFPCEWEIKE